MSTNQPALSSVHISRRSIVLLLGINLLALAVRLIFFSGLQGSDDAIYLAHAYDFAEHGTIDRTPSHWVGRILVWMPVAAALRLGLSAQVALTWFPIVCSMVSLNAVFAAARARLGERAALLAALLFAFFPLDAIYSTTSYCDGPIACFTFLTLMFFLWQYESSHPIRYGICAGLSFAAAYLCRESVLVLALPLAVIALLKGRVVRVVAAGAVGAIVPLAVETAFWSSQTGDPLYRLHSTSGSVENQTVLREQILNQMQQPGAWRWPMGPPELPPYYHQNPLLDAAHSLFVNEEYALFMIVGIPLLLWQLIRRDRVDWEFQFWFWSLLLVMLFFPFHRGRYTLRHDPRYCTAVVAPLCVCLAHVIDTWQRPVLRIGLSLLLITTAIGGLVVTQYSRTQPGFYELHEFRKAHAGTPLWVAPRPAVMLAYQSTYDGDADVGLLLMEGARTSNRFLEYIRYRPDVAIAEHPSEIRNGFVIVSERYTEPLPPHWKQVALFGDKTPLVSKWTLEFAKFVGIPERVAERVVPVKGRMAAYSVEAK